MPGRGRAHLPIGTWGYISINPAPSSVPSRPVYQARARFRDSDGVTRSVMRSGQTKAAARTTLLQALAARQTHVQEGQVTGATSIRELAEKWREQEQAAWSQNTRSAYLVNLKRIEAALGGVLLRELRRSGINTALQAIVEEHGVAAARKCKSTLSNLMKYALQFDAIDSNPVRDSITIKSVKGTTKRPDALTPAQVDDMLALIAANQPARSAGTLLDLVTWMLGTGCRVGEALAARYVNLDPTEGTWEVTGTVVRIHHAGLQVQPRTKTEAGWRKIVLPPHVWALTERRRDDMNNRWGPDRPATQLGLIFPSWIGTVWDPSLAARELRKALGGKEGPYTHVTTHTLRRTAITRLDEAGMSPREIAVWAGHADPSITQKVYMARNIVAPQAATILDRSPEAS